MKSLLAALMFFTRLPFHRLFTLPTHYFEHVVPYWPWVGWLTGGVTAGVLWLAAQLFPLSVAWLIAIAVRLLITGCLHEDGLADFLDGFGGGTTRERTLAIMKDSHIGTYGVVGLILYFLLLFGMAHLSLSLLCAVAFAADAYAKWVASHVINLLPYARPESDSKAGVVYSRMSRTELLVGAPAGLLPVLVVLPVSLWWACLAPPVVFLLLTHLMRKRLGGYTGDCCGALFLLCELSFYLVALALALAWR